MSRPQTMMYTQNDLTLLRQTIVLLYTKGFDYFSKQPYSLWKHMLWLVYCEKKFVTT